MTSLTRCRLADEVPEEGEQWGNIANDFDRVILPGLVSSEWTVFSRQY